MSEVGRQPASREEVIQFCDWWIEHLDAAIHRLSEHLERMTCPPSDPTYYARSLELVKLQTKRRAYRSVWEFTTGTDRPGSQSAG